VACGVLAELGSEFGYSVVNWAIRHEPPAASLLLHMFLRRKKESKRRGQKEERKEQKDVDYQVSP
jgi:hypothetical protein